MSVLSVRAPQYPVSGQVGLWTALWSALRAAVLLTVLSLGFSAGLATGAQAQSPELTQFLAALEILDTDTMSRLVYEIPDSDRLTAYDAVTAGFTTGQIDEDRFNTLVDFLGQDGIRLGFGLADARAMAENDKKTTGSILGVVMDDASLSPLAGVTVSAGDITTTTQADGTFQLDGLAPGDHTVTFELGDKYQPATATQFVVVGGRSAMMLALKPLATAPVDVATGTITGVITLAETRQPAAGVQVVLTSGNSALDLFDPTKTLALTTDAQGRFRADDFPAGKLAFMILNPGALLLPIGEDLTLKEGQTLDIQRALQPLRPKAPAPLMVIKGVVLDALTGAPVAGVQILSGGDGSAISGPRGRFRINGLHPGPQALAATGQGYADTRLDLGELAAGIHKVEVKMRSATIGTLVVKVVDGRDGAALAGVQVVIAEAEGRTDKTGQVTRTDLVAGQTQVTARADSFKPTQGQAQVVAGTSRVLVLRLDPITEGRVSGRVIDGETGAPVAGAQLALGGLSATSGADGSFGWEAVPGGAVRIEATHARYHAAGAALQVQAARENRVEITLQPITTGTLMVRVLDGETGKPLGGVTVGAGTLTAQSDVNGVVRFDPIEAGQIALSATLAGYNAASDSVQVQRLETASRNLTLDPITTGTLMVRILDGETGKPLGGVTVGAGTLTAQSDANGVVRFDPIEAGDIALSATLPGYHAASDSAQVQRLETASRKLTLGPITTGTLMVRILDGETGKPLGGVTVGAGTLTARSDVNGVAQFDPIEAGDIALSATLPGYHAASDAVQVRRLETVSRKIALDPITTGTITGRVVNAATKAGVAGAEVRLGSRLVTTDARGGFRMDKVAAGQVALGASAPLYEPANANLTPARAASANVTMALRPITYGTVTGLVLDAATGQPIGGAEVTLAATALTAGNDGRFSQARVAAGKVQVAASAAGYIAGASQGDLAAGDTIAITVRLQPITIGTVTGIITDKVTGRPVAGAQVTVAGQVIETDAQGRFSLADVPAGPVSVQVRDADYGDASGTGKLGRGGTLDLTIDLSARSEDVAALRSALDQGGVVDLYGIRFDSGKDQFKPSSLPTLRAMLELMTNAPGQHFVVEGHTDSDGSEGYNQALSERRAATVVRWLSKRGIDPSRLLARGLGEKRPVATNETASGKALNRRVVLAIAP